MMNKSLLLLLFFAVLIIGSYGKATQLRDNLEKRATGMSEQSLHVKKMLSRKNPMIKGMISSKAAKPVPSPKPNPRCPVARCAPPRPGCKKVHTEEKDSDGCPKHPCGKVVCEDEPGPVPVPCPMPMCARTMIPPGCKMERSNEKDSRGCPKDPCGKLKCGPIAGPQPCPKLAKYCPKGMKRVIKPGYEGNRHLGRPRWGRVNKREETPAERAERRRKGLRDARKAKAGKRSKNDNKERKRRRRLLAKNEENALQPHVMRERCGPVYVCVPTTPSFDYGHSIDEHGDKIYARRI